MVLCRIFTACKVICDGSSQWSQKYSSRGRCVLNRYVFEDQIDFIQAATIAGDEVRDCLLLKIEAVWRVESG